MQPQPCAVVPSYRSPRALRLVLLALGLEVKRARCPWTRASKG
jgi:hypothetical protein